MRFFMRVLTVCLLPFLLMPAPLWARAEKRQFATDASASVKRPADLDIAAASEKKQGNTGKRANTNNEEKEEGKDDKFKKLEAGVRILLVFPSMPQIAPFSEASLNLFRSSLGKTDQLGIVVAKSKQTLLPLTEEAQISVPSAKIVAGFKSGREAEDHTNTRDSEGGDDLDETIRNAVAQLSDLDGLLKTVVLVLDRPVHLSSEKPGAPKRGDDTTDTISGDGDSALSTLSTLLALNNVILYTVYPENISSSHLEKLTEQTGGKNIYLSKRVSLNSALYSAYDSILLRTIQLAPQTALYDSDNVCEPCLDGKNQAGMKTTSKDVDQLIDSGMNTWVVTLLIFMLGSIVGVLVLLAAIWQRLPRPGGQPAAMAEENGDKEEKAPMAFSKLTIGINRVRNSFSDMESKLHALSVDMDDFGSENWEIQKKIVSAYADISKELFLLKDHLMLNDDVQRSFDVAWVLRKIDQAFEINGIEEIVPEEGTRFHSKYHSHAGERQSTMKAGTVLEVVRKGYQRKGFVSDEPFVLRQAEVIVSAGNEQG